MRPPVPRVHPSSRRPPGHLQFESMTQIKLITAFWYQNTGLGSGAYHHRALGDAVRLGEFTLLHGLGVFADRYVEFKP